MRAESRKPCVVQVINSTYGARGQIGFRAQFVKNALDAQGIANAILARDKRAQASDVHRVLPLGQLIPRALNAYRMLIDARFDNRAWDTRLFDRFAVPALRRLLQDGESMHRVVHLWESSPMLAELALRSGARLVVDVPIAPSHEVIRLMQLGLAEDISVPRVNEREDKTLAMADLVVSPSRYVSDVLVRMGVQPERIRMVPFGCALRPSRFPKAKPDGGLTYLFMGTLSRRKGLRFLLEAWTRANLRSDRLVLCGRVTRAARELLAMFQAPNIEITGHVDVEPYLDAADVFVLPTLMEGSSKAVYEAMGAGLAIITTPNSGTVAVDEQEALIVPAGDSDSLMRAILRLKDDADLRARLGVAARAKAGEYTWERYGQSVVATYRSLMD